MPRFSPRPIKAVAVRIMKTLFVASFLYQGCGPVSAGGAVVVVGCVVVAGGVVAAVVCCVAAGGVVAGVWLARGVVLGTGGGSSSFFCLLSRFPLSSPIMKVSTVVPRDIQVA